MPVWNGVIDMPRDLRKIFRKWARNYKKVIKIAQGDDKYIVCIEKQMSFTPMGRLRKQEVYVINVFIYKGNNRFEKISIDTFSIYKAKAYKEFYRILKKF